MEAMRINALGWVCPKPVLETKKLLDAVEEATVIVSVDNEIAVSNLMKLANSLGCRASSEQKEEKVYEVVIVKEACAQCRTAAVDPSTLVIAITSDVFGGGDDELGTNLMKSYIAALEEADKLPNSLIFINGGVKLTTEGSPVLDSLKAMEAKGVEIMSCGACLNFYGLTDKLQVGSISNMYVFVEKMNAASNTIRL